MTAGRFQSLRWRILLWMLPIALGPLFIMAVQGYHCAREAVISSEREHLESVLISRQTRLNAWLEQIASDFRFLQVSPCLRGLCHGDDAGQHAACRSEACNLLNDLKAGSPFYSYLGTYDAQWGLLTSTSDSESHVHSEDDHGAFDQNHPLRAQLVAATELVFAPPHVCADGDLILQAGRRLATTGSPGVVYLVADINASEAVDPILGDRTGLGRTGRAYLTVDGQIYPVPEKGGSEERDRVSREGIARYRSPLGGTVIGIATPIPALGSRLVVEIEEREAFRWLGVLRTRAIFTGLLTLVLVLVLAAGAARLLAAPLRELASVARRIADGQVEQRVGRLPGTEAQALAATFNEMVDRLAATHRRLQQTAALAAVGELSSSIVHEMRNPLSSIKMNLQALGAKVAGDATHTELADIASEQVMRLERMLTELLQYGKPLQLELAELTFADLAQEVTELARPEIEDRALQVTVIDETGGEGLHADPEQLTRALTNLLVNAIQASPHGARVEFLARRDSGFEISVADRGAGFPDEVAAQLFQPFFTTRDEGTGLGLANVKKIVECHGGTVFARNRTGGGARIGLRLPWRGVVA